MFHGAALRAPPRHRKPRAGQSPVTGRAALGSLGVAWGLRPRRHRLPREESGGEAEAGAMVERRRRVGRFQRARARPVRCG